MRSLWVMALLLISGTPMASAAVFTVKPSTQFFADPFAVYRLPLDLPEVRVHMPPPQDRLGFCRFRLLYRIVDRGRADLPTHAWARCVSIDRLVTD